MNYFFWNYSYNYIQWKLGKESHTVNFKPASEVTKLGLLSRLAIHTVVAITVLATLFGGAFEIKPVRAQVIRRSRGLTNHVRRVKVPDIDMPSVNFHVRAHHVHAR